MAVAALLIPSITWLTTALYIRYLCYCRWEFDATTNISFLLDTPDESMTREEKEEREEEAKVVVELKESDETLNMTAEIN